MDKPVITTVDKKMPEATGEHFAIINFYRFVHLAAPEDLAAASKAKCIELGIKGKILFAKEGINGALSGAPEKLDLLMAWLRERQEFAGLEAKLSTGTTLPFKRMITRVKKSIVTFAREADPTPQEIDNAPRLKPEKWREILQNNLQDAVILDSRNDYEVEWGTFTGAEHLGIARFADFPEAFLKKYGTEKERPYLLFCTGGIRCEKAAAWAKTQGFSNVTQLDGGILKYLEEYGSDQWNGSCFVFDHRWAVSPELKESSEAPVTELIQPKPSLEGISQHTRERKDA